MPGWSSVALSVDQTPDQHGFLYHGFLLRLQTPELREEGNMLLQLKSYQVNPNIIISSVLKRVT